MYRFLVNGVMTYSDKWAVADSKNLIAISCSATEITMKTATLALRPKDGSKKGFKAMLYDNDNLANSPGNVNMTAYEGKDVLVEQGVIDVNDGGYSHRSGYKNIFAWARGANISPNAYFPICAEGEEDKLPFLWHRMMEERSSKIVSIRKWAPIIWDDMLGTNMRSGGGGTISDLTCYGMGGVQVVIDEEKLQLRISKLVAAGRMKEAEKEEDTA